MPKRLQFPRPIMRHATSLRGSSEVARAKTQRLNECSAPRLWILWISVREWQLGHERQGVALVDSIAADFGAPRPKESVAGSPLSPSRRPL